MALAGQIILVIGAYLVGSVSAAIITCRMFRLPDPRTSGSNNPGATNVLRVGGKIPALVTLLGDMLKGLVPVIVANYLGTPQHFVALIGIAAVLGHVFPVFFQFRGGKGVATALGTLAGAAPVIGLLAITTWLATCLLFRISSVAALVTFALVPLFLLIQNSNWLALGFTVIGLLLFYTHRSNLQRLLKGEEPKLGKTK